MVVELKKKGTTMQWLWECYLNVGFPRFFRQLSCHTLMWLVFERYSGLNGWWIRAYFHHRGLQLTPAGLLGAGKGYEMGW
jgi:hypothetical protein